VPTDNGDGSRPEQKSLAAEIVEQLRADDNDKELMAAEIANQLKPVNDAINEIKSWMLGLWSNGSKQPEGYLQRARAEDKRHIADIMSNQQDLSRRVGVVEDYIERQKIIREERERQDAQKAAVIKDSLDNTDKKVNRRIGTQNLILTIAALVVSMFMAWITYKEYTRHASVDNSPTPTTAELTLPTTITLTKEN
jgi:hypothetical protein